MTALESTTYKETPMSPDGVKRERAQTSAPAAPQALPKGENMLELILALVYLVLLIAAISDA
jgi:hypothetical protein